MITINPHNSLSDTLGEPTAAAEKRPVGRPKGARDKATRKHGIQTIQKAKVDTWKTFHDDWIRQNLSGVRLFTLKQLAAKYRLRYGDVRFHAAREDWVGELRGRVQEIRLESSAKMVDKGVFNEIEVRTRHAKVARMMLDKAIEKLRLVNPKKLTVSEATKLAALAMEQERLALGMPNLFSFVPTSLDAEGKYKPVIDHVNEQLKMRQLSNKLLDFIEGQSTRVKEGKEDKEK